MQIICKDDIIVDIDLELFIANTTYFKNLCTGGFIEEDRKYLKCLELFWCDSLCIHIFEDYFRKHQAGFIEQSLHSGDTTPVQMNNVAVKEIREKKLVIKKSDALNIIYEIWHLVEFLVPCIDLQKDLYKYYSKVLKQVSHAELISAVEGLDLFSDDVLRKYLGFQIAMNSSFTEKEFIKYFPKYFPTISKDVVGLLVNFKVNNNELDLVYNKGYFFKMWEDNKSKFKGRKSYNDTYRILYKPFDVFQKEKLIFKKSNIFQKDKLPFKKDHTVESNDKYFVFENIVYTSGSKWYDFPELSYLLTTKDENKEEKYDLIKIPKDIITKYRLFDYMVTFKGYTPDKIKDLKKQYKYINKPELFPGVVTNNRIYLKIDTSSDSKYDFEKFINYIATIYGNINGYYFDKKIDYIFIEFEKYGSALRFIINNQIQYRNNTNCFFVNLYFFSNSKSAINLLDSRLKDKKIDLKWEEDKVIKCNAKYINQCNPENVVWIYKKDLFASINKLTQKPNDKIQRILRKYFKISIDILRYLETPDKLYIESKDTINEKIKKHEIIHTIKNDSSINEFKFNKYSVLFEKGISYFKIYEEESEDDEEAEEYLDTDEEAILREDFDEEEESYNNENLKFQDVKDAGYSEDELKEYDEYGKEIYTPRETDDEDVEYSEEEM
jgi:hypothetical protein